MNKDLTQLRKDVTDNKTSQDALAEEVKIVKEKSKKNEDMIAKNVETTQQTIFSEIREREEKKCNLIIHNLLESSGAGSGLDRKQYDIDCIMEIMEEISVTFGKDDIKFIRRLGEKTDDDKIRPVQLGVKAITTKENILSHAKRLKDSADYYEVNIVPDLTKQQRKEEDDLSKEVTKRNLELDPEVSLNSEWKLVGPKGQKRLDNVLKVIGYDLISDLRKDRTDTTNGIGGGILVYAKNGLAVLSIDNLSDFNQYAHFRISTSLCDMNIFLIYRPPSSSKANNEMLCNLIKNAPKDSLIIGDINFPKIDWNNLTSDAFSSDFLNSCIDNNFSQYVDFPTHSKNNILDLVLCNNDCVLNAENLGPLSNSDHVMILIRTCFDFVSTNNNDVKLNWSRANYSELKDEIANVDWPNLLSNDDVNLNWANFKQKLNTVIYKHVPLITTTSDNSKPIWMNNYIKRMLRKKSRLYKKMKLTKSESDTKNYKDAEKVTKKAIRNAKKKVEVRISKQNGNEDKNSFNKYVKSRLGKQTGIGPLLDEHNTVTSDGKKMADILNEHFSSVFSKDNVNVNNIEDLVFDSPIEDLIITKQDIEDKIDKLKPGKAPGPDGISTTLLIKLKFVISIPLQILFQESLSKGCVPTEWKKAKVIPIFKKGSKGKASNYRPVSLTSVACKLLESIIRDKITEHLIRNKLINTSQHGFTKNRSCQTNLLEFMDFITKCIDQGDPVDVIYLDFSKAFDKISHSKLALKLKAHGIRGKLLCWITDWLTNRSQWVCVNGALCAQNSNIKQKLIILLILLQIG